MYIRCNDCLACTWTEAPTETGLCVELVCNNCGRTFLSERYRELGTDRRGHHLKALQFSNEYKLDFGSAYSVLLGIMPLARAKSLQDFDIPSANAPTDPALVGQLAPAGTPPARPGNRRGRTERLMKRHGLPADLAALVVRGLLTVPDAMALVGQSAADAERRPTARRSSRRPPHPWSPRGKSGPPSASPLLKAVVLASAFVLIATVAWGAWQREFGRVPEPTVGHAGTSLSEVSVTEPTPSARPDPPTHPAVPVRSRLPVDDGIERDEQGAITRLSGPDPRSVLRVYCDAQPEGLEPVAIVDSVPRRHDARLGIFRDLRVPGPPKAIRIRKDWRSRLWTAGVHTGPIRVYEAPASYSMPIPAADRASDGLAEATGMPSG